MDDQLAPSMTISAQMADAGFRDALRLFQHDAAALREIGPSLETTVTPPEPPRVVSSDVIESTTVRSHRIADPPTPGFDAFLDGGQVLDRYLHGEGRLSTLVTVRRQAGATLEP